MGGVKLGGEQGVCALKREGLEPPYELMDCSFSFICFSGLQSFANFDWHCIETILCKTFSHNNAL